MLLNDYRSAPLLSAFRRDYRLSADVPFGGVQLVVVAT